MFTKILYPSDFSDVAAKALRYIRPLRAAGCREVVKVHRINQRIIAGLMRNAMLDRDIAQWRTKAEEAAHESPEEVKRESEQAGFGVKTIVKTGFPSNVILDVEKQQAPP